MSKQVLPADVQAHLQAWFGGWSDHTSGIVVIESDMRTVPGWDGKVLPVLGLARGDWALLSVAPGQGAFTDAQLHNTPVADIAETAGLMTTKFRWCLEPAPGEDHGEWCSINDERVPAWLRPFNDEVLIAWDDDGNYGGGVGLKKHNPLGHEISVGTEEALRGRGIARRLVETATRRILRDGAVATYMHLLDNIASEKVADRAGFTDEGWRYLGTPED